MSNSGKLNPNPLSFKLYSLTILIFIPVSIDNDPVIKSDLVPENATRV
jgi:hypothetical protein